MADFHVAIVGAGLDGLCLGQALHVAGIALPMHGRDTSASSCAQGARIGIDKGGQRALSQGLPPAQCAGPGAAKLQRATRPATTAWSLCTAIASSTKTWTRPWTEGTGPLKNATVVFVGGLVVIANAVRLAQRAQRPDQARLPAVANSNAGRALFGPAQRLQIPFAGEGIALGLEAAQESPPRWRDAL